MIGGKQINCATEATEATQAYNVHLLCLFTRQAVKASSAYSVQMLFENASTRLSPVRRERSFV